MMEAEDKSRTTGENSPIGNKETPLSSRSTQKQGPGDPKKSKSLKEHNNPIVRGIAHMGYWVWIIVMVVGLGLAFLVSIALL